MTTKMLPGLSAVVDDYDLFLVDQWGVLHNGEVAHPGAVDAMEKLRATGHKVIILSNSGKRVEDSFERMERMGIHTGLYDHVVTSGEQVHSNFQKMTDPVYKSLGQRYLIFTWDEGNKAVMDGSGKTEVEDIAEADFIMCTGTNQGDLDYYVPILEKARARELPLLCANPDLVSVAPDGTLKMCPGKVALTYEEMGGRVRWHGKPTTEIYDFCKSLEPQAKRILGVGDSLRHDIQGAQQAGGHGLFVCGGIHGPELGDPVDEGKLAALCGDVGITPEYAVPKFVW